MMNSSPAELPTVSDLRELLLSMVGDGFEDFVAALVTQRVVEEFEAVKVNHDARQIVGRNADRLGKRCAPW